MRPKKPIPAQESLTELIFPLQGIDVSTEFELQPDQTTPIGQNVRGYEPSTMRARGGSRPGISRYINAQVLGRASLIQHLNYVVSDDGNALWASNDPLDGGGQGGTMDPSTNNGGGGLGIRNPGRYVRTGGSGVGLNRNKYTGARPTPTITPNNITKAQGTLFTFLGTEFTATGLLPGDKILSVTLTSAGTPASAAGGNYQIGAAFAIGNTSFGQHQLAGKYNNVVYKTGIMTVTPLVPQAYSQFKQGGGGHIRFGDGTIPIHASDPPLGQGQKNWRVIQYLKADGQAPTRISESGSMDPSGFPTGISSPATITAAFTDFTQPITSYSTEVRLEYSPDGTNWPTPPTL